ncbi:MAG: hypothetical protein IPM42_19310 [Saprospiraceae bacterium]|nr:hypothetical protein [Saprospiraceae bacterium]
MKNLKNKLTFGSLVLMSLSSSIILEFQTSRYEETHSIVEMVENSRLESFTLPDVSFLQNLLQSLFNFIS